MTITSGAHTFELVEYVPEGYEIWNIGVNMIDGYLPLAEVEGNQVNPDTLKAIKIDGAQTILKAVGRGQKTIKDMERYVKRYDSSKTERIIRHVQNLRSALEVMYTLQWGKPQEVERNQEEKEMTKLKDINGKGLEAGQVVEIKGGFFKSDNGIFKVIRTPESKGYIGCSCWLERLNKNGTFSKSKYSGQFWPLMITTNSIKKRIEAREHNEKHAIILILSEDLQQVKKIREVQEIAKNELISEGVEKVREENGYYKGYKLHDIVEELTNYGLSYEDAKKEIMELYDQQQTTTKPEPQKAKEITKSELLQQGADKIKTMGRMKTSDFEDIILKLASYGLGYVDAYNQITGLYLYQLEQEEQQAQQATAEAEPQTEEVEAISAICAGCLNYKKDCNGMTNHFTGCIYYTVKEKQKEKTEATPEQAEENNGLKVEISYNEEKNGIELKFDGKPSNEVREQLKANGFRWSKYQRLWYAKDTPERRAFAESFNGTLTASEPKAFEYPEIDIDDLDSYTIDQEVSKRENNNSIFRSKERNHSQELQEILQHYQAQAIEIIDKTDSPDIIYHIKKDLQRFKKAYYNNYVSTLTHRANNPSWAVTGRAGRNVRKDNKAMSRYDKLMSESIEITDKFKQSLSRSRNKIRAASRQAVYKEIEDTDVEISFTVKQKEVSGYSKRTYNYNNYMIVNIWGCFRIFKDGKEIKELRTADTLQRAKKTLQLIVNNEDKKVIHQAI